MRGVLLAGIAAVALATGASASALPNVEPQAYCPGTTSASAGQTLTDTEHRVVVGDPPLPRRARQRRVKVNGVTTTVTEAGPRRARRAVVFAHGSPEYSRDFDRLLVGASRYGRAIEFDFPGYGHADDRVGGPYDLDGAARYFGALMRRLGVRKVDLVMHDFGGPWALQWAAKHPKALRSVVVVNSGVFIGYAGHPDAAAWVTPGVGEAEMATMTRQEFKSSAQAHNPKPLPNVFLDRMYDVFDRGTRCAMLHYYRDMGERSADKVGRAQAAVLRRRRRPALVVWGEKDQYIPLSLAYKQRMAFPGARVAVIPNAGHFPYVDDPRRVNAVVMPFLRRVLAGRKHYKPGRRHVRSLRRRR
jgi:pimeloyl-ACP methyl ester carboxylesterase